jgi:hypothetical protein
MAKPKKRPARKSAPKKPGRKAALPRKISTSEQDALARRIAQALGISPAEATMRALRELAERVAPQSPSRPDPAHEQAEKLHAQVGKAHALAEQTHQRAEAAHVKAAAPREQQSGLPERLYLLLDGRGLDGRGMPVEVIDLPTVVGSERHCTVWVNSPQIETRHVQFTRDEGDWYVEDLGSTHGTFLGDQRITRRRVQDGDEYRLAGYLRLRTEVR